MILTLSSTYYTIDGTERGVLLDWGNPQSNPVEPGLHFKIPYQQEVVRFNMQTQKFTTIAESASKDLQDVKTEVTTNYRLDPSKISKIYSDLGNDMSVIETKVIVPAVQETVKQVTAEFTASDLIQKRANVKAGVEVGIRNRLSQYGILVDPNGVSLTGFDYSPEFSAAIEAKVTAVQLKDKAANDLERVKIEADQKIAQAQADKQYATPEMIQLKKLEIQRDFIAKWDGKMPQYTMGDSGIMSMLNIGQTATA